MTRFNKLMSRMLVPKVTLAGARHRHSIQTQLFHYLNSSQNHQLHLTHTHHFQPVPHLFRLTATYPRYGSLCPLLAQP
jgi:hypothetical protein